MKQQNVSTYKEKNDMGHKRKITSKRNAEIFIYT